jgi:hypothetical protein
VFEEFTPTCEAADCGRALDADRPALVFREEAGEQRGAIVTDSTGAVFQH